MKKRMNLVLAAAMAGALSLAIIAPASAEEAQAPVAPEMAADLDDSSNKVVIYSGAEEYRNEYFLQRIQEEFPDYDVTIEYMPTGNLAAKLAAEGTEPENIAVLYRAHYLTRAIETVFQKRKIEYEIHGGLRFYDRKEIKDALAYLRLLVYKDDLSFRRVCNVPRRNIGEKRMEFLENYAQEQGCSLYEAMNDNLEH